MHTHENKLIFSGDIQKTPLQSLAALHQLIAKFRYSDIELDFRSVRKLWHSHMIPLVAICRNYRQENINFDIILPDDSKLAGLMINTNWLHLIDPEHFSLNDKSHVSHLSARQFRTAEERYKAVDQSLDIIIGSVAGIDRNRIKALEWALDEITGNVLDHSESAIGGIVQVTTFPKKNMVEFNVCDTGITIPRSLRSGRSDLLDDTSAMRAAINEGVTRDKGTNQGNGLFGTFRCCETSGGEFEIISGCISLRHSPGEMQVVRNTVPFQGTYVRAAISYTFDRLLEKALVFSGRAHDPGFDYVERKYESGGDRINFVVKDEISDFGSRPAGKFARTKVENLMDKQRNPITFDFDGVNIISSSFADEVFGRLFLSLGPVRFGQLCQFDNINSTVRLLIDRSIAQRMVTG
jgi:STAS-like domain of unknown function (DUF4325)